MLGLIVLVLSGCSDGQIATENDGLRRQVLELRKENEQLRQRETELTFELQQDSRRPDALPPEIRENTPHVASISIGPRSHVRDQDDDGIPDRILVYVTPADGYGRFIQLVGSLSMHAVILPPDADAITIGRVTLEPFELRAAYRSGITGTHYTIELPIENLPKPAESTCILRVLFEDGLTGQQRSAEHEVSFQR